jgi:hypothetical protein
MLAISLFAGCYQRLTLAYAETHFDAKSKNKWHALLSTHCAFASLGLF